MATNENSVPGIRTFQFDPGRIGSVKKSVNLFRGDVNFPVNLISLPGRNGLDANVTAFYDGNVQQQVNTWNMESPTGVLGVGWSLPFDRIELSNPDNSSAYGNQYYLIAGGAGYLLVRAPSGDATPDGALEFKTQDYNFWNILYYPNQECWKITDENGLTYTYGGLSNSADSNETSQGNSIQWGVKWKNWLGSSSLTGGTQERFALAWNLYQIQNSWGDSITYKYEIEQQHVGLGGLNYTKACYLESITDVYGRRIVFNYENKIYSAGQQEYQDPNKALVPADDPSDLPSNLYDANAYQDKYETRYLAKIVVNSKNGKPLFTIKFDYGSGLIKFGSASVPGLWKRYLFSISQQNLDAQSLPGMEFSYYQNADTLNAYPGALQTITYPEGAVVTYTYEQSSLPNSSRQFEIQSINDQQIPLSGKTPRIWFGDDYLVLTLYDSQANQLYVSVYSWAGWWVEYYCDSFSCTQQGFKSLQVATEEDFFAIYYKGASQIITYRRSEYQYGSWASYNISVAEQSSSTDAICTIVSGDNFVIVYDPDFNGNALQGYYWQNTLVNPWVSLEGFLPSANNSSQVALAGQGNYFIVYSSTGDYNVNLCYFDDLGMPNYGSQWNSDFGVYNLLDGQAFWWALGETFAVATYITGLSESTINYEVQIFQWDENFNVQDQSPPAEQYQASQDDPLIAGIFENSLVASGPHLLRYTGENGWNEYDFSLDPNNTDYQFAYDNDTAVISSSSGNDVQFAQFCPNELSVSPSSGWSTANNPLSGAGNATVSGYYLTFNSVVYYRQPLQGNSPTWQQLGGSLSELGDINSQSVQNMAPGYIVCESLDGGTTYVAILANGDLKTVEPLNEQYFYIESPQPGTQLADFNTFITWAGSDNFDSATTIYLNRVAGQSATGAINDCRVSSITIDDGYAPDNLRANLAYTYYKYDDSTATFDPSGNVAQYSEVTVIPGVLDDRDGTPYGYTKQYFFNGLDPQHLNMVQPSDPTITNAADYYSLLNGYLLHSNVYDSDNKILSFETNWWWIFARSLNAIEEGTYIRQSKKATTSNNSLLFTVTNSDLAGYLSEDNMEAVCEEFQNNGVPISNDSYILIAVEYEWWVIFDPAQQKLYFVFEQDSDTFNVYSGVSGIVETLYNDYGLTLQTATYNYNSDGQAEVIYTTLKYGCQEPTYNQGSNGMLARNLLTPVIQQTTSSNILGSDTDLPTITGTNVTTWKDYGNGSGEWARYKTYQARTREAAEAGFDFSSTNDPPSSQWTKISEACSRTSTGLILESLNVDGVYKTITYDTAQVFPVAGFNNAHVEEVSFYGFEDYENTQGWIFNTDDIVTTGDAHTGSNSLKIAGNPDQMTGLQNTFQLQNSSDSPEYVLSCWVWTQEGFGADSGNAYWQITVNGAVIGAPVQISDTGEQWMYLYIPIDLSSMGPNRSVDLGVLLYSQKSSTYLLVDDVRFSPLVCQFEANVYDPYYWNVIAELGVHGETFRHVYDRFQRPIATVGPDENVDTLTTSFYSRAGNDDVYSPLGPNSNLAIQARCGGIYNNFNTGDNQWQTIWRPDNAQNWAVQNRALAHTDAIDGYLTLSNSDQSRNYGAYFKLGPTGSTPLTISQPMGVKIGDTVTAQWKPSKGWELYKGQTLVQSVSADQVATEWLFIAAQNAILFYADGEQIFTYNEFTDTVSGSLSIFTGDTVLFEDITVFYNPIISIDYLDGTGRTRQTQMLEGQNCLSAETVYDALGWKVAVTKRIRYEGTLLGYQRTLVESFDWTTGVMSGDVAKYYSDDGGYPYSGARFENSPLSRVVERGAPGQDFAITTPNAQHTIKYSYGINGSDDWSVLGLPAGQYATTTVTDQDGMQMVTLSDRTGKKIARIKGLTTPGGSEYQITSYQYDQSGNMIAVGLPNRFTGGSENSGWENTFIYNFIGQVVQSCKVDSNKSSCIYDKAGRLRFLQDAEGADKGYLLYTTYDVFGRPLEKGVLKYDWSQITQDNADDDLYLPSGVTPTLSKIYHYDKCPPSTNQDLSQYGGAPYLIDRLSSVSSYFNDQNDHVQESFTYDVSGNVTATGINVASYDEKVYQTFYGYDNLSNITSISYSIIGSSDQPFQVLYAYDDLGRLAGIGKTQDNPVDYAVYTYKADGSIGTETLNSANPGSTVQRAYSYNSPGWIEEISDNFFDESIQYTSGGYDENMPGYYDGKIAQAAFTFKWNDAPANYSFQYQYDNLGRLQVAENSLGDQDSIGINKQVSYDENGNIQVFSSADRIENYSYGNNDRVFNTDGSQNQDYSYDETGNIIGAPARSSNGISYCPLILSYDQFTNLPLSVEGGQVAGQSSLFQYDDRNRRVLKQVEENNSVSSSQLYINSIKSAPLVQANGEDVAFYIQGLNGLIGMCKNNSLYFILKDHEGSSRVVFDEGGNVAATIDYLPFGQIMRASKMGLLNYLYTGQEFDSETGLYNYQVRLYDSLLRRFYSTDPDAQFPSPYVYAGNDPTLFVDPTGEWSKKDWGILVGALEVIGGVIITLATEGALGSTIGAALIGAGCSGIKYSYKSKNFSWPGWDRADASGAITGAITGIMGAGTGALVMRFGLQDLDATIGYMVGGAVTGLVSSLAGNALQPAVGDETWSQAFGLNRLLGDVESAGLGFLAGAASNFISGKLNDYLDAKPATGQYQPIEDDVSEDTSASAPPKQTISLKKFLLGKNEYYFHGSSWEKWPTGMLRRLPGLLNPTAFNSKKFFWPDPTE